MSGLLSNFCPSKARRGSSLFDGICLHGTWLDAVQDGVVPIGIKARDFALRIKTQEIGVGYEYDLSFPKIASGLIGTVGQNHRIILSDDCDPAHALAFRG